MTESAETVVYDLAIIGGGIAGSAVLREASLRHMKTILLEKNTLGSGTSSKSSKLIHGGLRYLETAWNDLLKGHIKSAWKNFSFVCSSLKESRILHRAAPRLIHPTPLLIPIYKNKGQNFWLVSAGAALYGFLGVLFGSARFPEFLMSAEKVLAKEPHLEPRDLKGGIIIWDHITDDHALVRAVAASALRAGGDYLEHCRVISWKPLEAGYVIQAEIKSEPHTFYAKSILVAAGPWTDVVKNAQGYKSTGDFLIPLAGSHLNVRLFLNHSVILQAEDGRIFFVINHDGVSRIGTTERLHDNPDQVEVTPEERQYLLNEVNRYFPNVQLSAANILSEDAGIRPIARSSAETGVHFASREHEIRRTEDGTYWLLGVKLTDHRRAAVQMIQRLLKDQLPEKKAAGMMDLSQSVPF